MSPRPRKASDDEVFAATLRMMARLGPQQITLADIASEVGLTPGALVQRFGSKRALLLTLSEKFAHSTSAMFESLRAAEPSPLATLYAYADCMAQLGGSPEALAHHLMWLQQDLTDPEFRRYTLVPARASWAKPSTPPRSRARSRSRSADRSWRGRYTRRARRPAGSAMISTRCSART